MELSFNILLKSILIFLTVGAWVICVPSLFMFVLGLIINLRYTGTPEERSEIPLNLQGNLKVWPWGVSTAISLTWIITSYIL